MLIMPGLSGIVSLQNCSLCPYDPAKFFVGEKQPEQLRFCLGALWLPRDATITGVKNCRFFTNRPSFAFVDKKDRIKPGGGFRDLRQPGLASGSCMKDLASSSGRPPRRIGQEIDIR